jgi:hypothetical protein
MHSLWTIALTARANWHKNTHPGGPWGAMPQVDPSASAPADLVPLPQHTRVTLQTGPRLAQGMGVSDGRTL